MNSTEQDNINFLLNKYKDIVKNDDGSFRLAHRCIPGDNDSYVKFVYTGRHNYNELEHNCYCHKCKYCELNHPFNYCLLRTTLENSSIKVPTHYVANCDAYDPIEYLNIIRNKSEMITFIEMIQQYFGSPEYCEKYFGFNPNVDDDTGEVLETIREYYERGGEFNNIPDKYPCVIYFPIDNIDIHKKLEWIYIGEEQRMKVIQNNYKNQPQNRHQTPEAIRPKLRVEKVKIKCENCGSVLEVSREDTHIGYLGLPYITCPCCNYEMDVEEFDDDAIDICASNVKYPTHFTVSSKDFRAIEISDEEINKWIQQRIEYFRGNPEAYSYFMGSGNSMIHMYKFDEDKEYYVVVSKDYESGEIEFEDEDYGTN